MKVVCAWCKKDMGEKPPLDDMSTTHSMCDLCYKIECIGFVAEKLRKEPFQTFGDNCLRKSIRFRKECREIGVNAKVVFALVIIRCERRFLPRYVIWFHTWAEVNGQRVELSRPLDEKNTAGALDSDSRPLIGIWI